MQLQLGACAVAGAENTIPTANAALKRICAKRRRL
jgi:hypothetical protein